MSQTRRTAVALTLACVLTGTVQQPAHAEPGTPSTLPEVRAELRRLYRDAERATEKYNAVDEKVTQQEKRVRTLTSQVRAAERKLGRLTSLAGAAARAQYRSGGMPAEVQFVLSSDPETALDNASLTRRAQQSTQGVLTALAETREDLSTRKDDASEELDGLRANRRSMAAERRTIEKNIAAARKVESRLKAEQRRRLAALEEKEADEAQAEWERSGILDQVGTEATPAGRRAIAYATKQLGKPYVWGAEGPDSFDCSGLTSQAWLHAGVTIPRTSEEQWRQLTRIPVASMRPGDLIIYYDDASHVAIYIGDGEVIQAPRPGRWVYVSPVASMEILGVVRPDA
ncbi:NLP/P60-family secreted protein [Streptomyces davaonensis JCM 4913]|uniref:NLP/P60-family secreted protein n=1 Tax=Streptomyces davaonensis (strain DSM 101723 / JCM 4913 / KCC S-0913 / 768) TaxID=1214101 RepID=K4QX47_STRDJ|nr:C40 family peptidase [Streptomyces davaonensis]CCK25623.1 NLP/P60-family secreted protein [Streptomyces davaonensis JCM 4913]